MMNRVLIVLLTSVLVGACGDKVETTQLTCQASGLSLITSRTVAKTLTYGVKKVGGRVVEVSDGELLFKKERSLAKDEGGGIKKFTLLVLDGDAMHLKTQYERDGREGATSTTTIDKAGSFKSDMELLGFFRPTGVCQTSASAF